MSRIDKISTIIQKKLKEKEEREEQSRLEYKRQRDADIKADEDYKRKIAKYAADGEKAATIIWNWFNDSKPEWEACKIKKLGRNLRISRDLTTQGRYSETRIFFSIDENYLYAHYIVKYGKTHIIRQLSDLIEHVPSEILIQFADTIKNDSIWDVIENNLTT